MIHSVRRRLSGALGALIIFMLLLIAKTASANSPCDCICDRGESEKGWRVVMSNKPGCKIYEAIKKHPQIDPSTKLPYPQQVQMRSIYAANLERKLDGSYQHNGVLRSCTPDGKPSPDADNEEKRRCSHLAFYYTLDGIEITIPKMRTYTPAEQAELDAAAAAEKQKQEKAAEQKKDEDRRELAAEKKARELEKQLEVQTAETKSRDDVIAANQEIAWRATFFKTAIVIIVLDSILAFIMTLWALASRFRLRPITADGYQYPDPREAVRDLEIKLSGARTKAQSETAKLAEELAGTRSRIAELDSQVAKQADSVSASARLVESFRKERDQYKSNLELLQQDRGQGVEGLKAEIARLQKQNEELLYHWNLADEARLELEAWRVKQRGLMHEKTAEIFDLRQKLEASEAARIKSENDFEALRFIHGTRLTNENDRLSARPEALHSLVDEADEDVTQIRQPSVTPAPKTPLKRRETAPYSLSSFSSSRPAGRPSSTETTQPSGPEADLALYQQGFELIGGYLFRGYGAMPTDEKLEDRIRRTVDAVSDVCSCATTARTQTCHPPDSSTGTIPPLSNSDIFRVAALMGVKDGFDLPGFQRGILGASNAHVAECLKTCIHEWAQRGRSGDLVLTLELPFEIYDLYALLDSQLLCGPDIISMLPDWFNDALDQVKHAGSAIFNRRPRMSSFPPAAMPQTSG